MSTQSPPIRIGRLAVLIVLAVALTLLVVILWLLLRTQIKVEHDALNAVTVYYGWLDVGVLLTIGFITPLIAFLLGYAILRSSEQHSRISELRHFVVMPVIEALHSANSIVYSTLASVDWKRLFDGANEILLLVQGWDGWPRDQSAQIRTFIGRGGKFRLIMHSPHAPNLLRFMSERSGRPPAEMVTEITATVENLRSLIEDVVGEQNVSEYLDVTYTSRMNWFCGILFKGDNKQNLLLSLYQHRKHVNESPAFIIPADEFSEVYAWFLNECAFLEKAPHGTKEIK